MLIAALVLQSTLAAATGAQAPPELARALVPLASDAVVVDRVPMALHRYRSVLAPARLFALWSGGASDRPPVRDIAGGWRVASRIEGSWQETLQVRSDGAGGSEVLRSRVDLRAPLARPESLPFALPAGGAVLRTLAFHDRAGRGSQFIVAIQGSPPRAMSLLCARLLEGGWQPVATDGCAMPVTAATAWFLRGAETLGLSLRASGRGSRAVIGFVSPQP